MITPDGWERTVVVRRFDSFAPADAPPCPECGRPMQPVTLQRAADGGRLRGGWLCLSDFRVWEGDPAPTEGRSQHSPAS